MAVVVPFESRLPSNCSCYWGPIWKQSRLHAHYSVRRGVFLKADSVLMICFVAFYKRIIRVSPKTRKIYVRNTSREGPERRARGKFLTRLSLNTPLVITSHACSRIYAHSVTVSPVYLFLTKIFSNMPLTLWHVLESQCMQHWRSY